MQSAMNLPPRPEQTLSHEDPIWVVIAGESVYERSFELRADRERVVLIGSAKHADVRVEGAAPVSCFVERDGDALWITPGHGDEELRVDTQKLAIRRRIYSMAVVEIGSKRLVIRTRDTPPTLRDPAGRVGEGFDYDSAFDELARNISQVDTLDHPRLALASAVRQPLTKAYERSELIPPDALPTQTIEIGPINFDEWGEERKVEATRSAQKTEKQFPSLPALALPETNRMLGAEREPAKTEVLNGGEIRRALAEASNLAGTWSATSPQSAVPHAVAADSGDALPTVGLRPIRFETPPVPRQLHKVERFAEVPRSKAIAPGTRQSSGDTTEYERPMLAAALQKRPAAAEREAQDSKGPRHQERSERDSRHPIVLAPARIAHSPLAQLGALAKSRPWHVLVAAGLGAVVLMFFLVGVVQLFHPRSARTVEMTQAVSRPKTAELSRRPETNPSASVVDAIAPAPTLAETTDVALDETSIALAVGHLIAGRHVEAEAAYRELATKHPKESSYAAIARILGRRNSGECRASSDSKKLCPTVKP